MSGQRRIILKSPREIDLMRTANVHTAEILQILIDNAAPGATTLDLDLIARAEIKRRKVKSPFLGYKGYPAVLCASLNQEVVHGIPDKRHVIKEGDIIGLDFGVICEGYVGDSARTVGIGKISAECQKLIDTTAASLEAAIAVCTPQNRLSDIGAAVEKFAIAQGYGVVRDFVGHGIGTAMHEDPQVPNYYDGPKPRLREGLVIAIEPMFNMGTGNVKVLADGWTVVTADGKPSAHFEHTVAITAAGPRVLSKL